MCKIFGVSLLPALILGVIFQGPVNAGVVIRGSLPSPQPVGTIVTWTAEATGAEGEIWYRFRVRQAGGEFWTIRDFGPGAELEWTSFETDGDYEIEAAARPPASDRIETALAPLTLTSRVTSGPVISPTKHPLVMLFSHAPCELGSRMRVVVLATQQVRQPTPWRSCTPGRSMNFLLAGLQANRGYTASAEIKSEGNSIYSAEVSFLTGPLPEGLPVVTPYVRRLEPHPFGTLLLAPLFPNLPTATDLEGEVIWYYPGAVSLLTRAEGGRFWGVIQSPGPKSLQRFREFDLTGMTLRESNAERINEQLRAMNKREISGFHHEARSLPDGRVLVLASNEQIMTDVQGEGDVNIVGDVILVLDQNLQVVWVWDGFDHLDPTEKALLDEKCSIGACPPIYLAADGNDWTHANSVQLAPDGSFIVSIRHLDCVIKINYANGEGDGAVIWRLGRDGDFSLDGAEGGWFSHQHDAALMENGFLILFDNGNVRRRDDNLVTSRGQIFALDETTRSARLLMNVDLGTYHFALGSAQVLPDGTFHFGAGWILPDNTAEAIEVDGIGSVWYSATINRPIYRSFRLPDLYSRQ
jgi:hypothetical protein